VKKALIALALLIIIFGVNYFQSVRHADDNKNAYRQGFVKGIEKTSALEQSMEAANDSLEFTKRTLSDSLSEVSKVFSRGIDSLGEVIMSKDQTIDSLARLAVQYKKSASKQAARKPEPTASENKHAQILGFYKQRFESLPKDLSVYENKVAVSEIRDETAQKFAITLSELDKIRDQHKLSY